MATNYFLFITNDSFDPDGSKIHAGLVLQKRLEQNIWEIYSNTANKKILKPGDLVLFYLAGSSKLAKHIVAEAKIAKVFDPPSKASQDTYGPTPERCVQFEEIKEYEKKVALIDKFDELSFIPKNRSKWGSAVQSGCRRILASDYEHLKSK